MAKRKARVYELQRDWSSPPFYKGTASEVAREVQDLTKSELAPGKKWHIGIAEVVRTAKRKPINTWAGSVTVERPSGGTASVLVQHNRHNTDWAKDVYSHVEQLRQLQWLPFLTDDVLRLSPSERKARWAKTSRDVDTLHEKYLDLLEQRDDMSDDLMAEVVDEFKALGMPASFRPAQGYNLRQIPKDWLRTPDWYEDSFQTKVKWANSNLLYEQRRVHGGKGQYRGYVMRPNGSYRKGKIAPVVAQEMFADNDFTPRKRGQARATQQSFPMGKGF